MATEDIRRYHTNPDGSVEYDAHGVPIPRVNRQLLTRGARMRPTRPDEVTRPRRGGKDASQPDA